MPLPLIAGGALLAGAIGSLFKNHAANKSAEEQAKLWNQYLADRQRVGGEIMDKLVAGGYDPFKPYTQVGTTSSTGSTSSSFSESETPTLSAEYQPMMALTRGILEKRLASGSGLPAGYVEQGIQSINQSAEGDINNIRNEERRRGMPTGSMTFANPADRARRQQIAQLRVEAPLKSRELQTQDLGLASNIAQAFGRGTKRSGRSSSTTSSSGTSTMTRPPDIGSLMALLMPPAPQAGKETGISTAGGLFSDIGSGLASIYGMGGFRSGSGGASSSPYDSLLDLPSPEEWAYMHPGQTYPG